MEPTLARKATDETALRAACALPGYVWEYLRFVQEDGTWRPAAGTFPGWPTAANALTVLDPCCGSGHFLTEALAALAALRRAEDGRSASEAVAAVLRDNLAGLEIDGRCVQIAAFNLALTGWRIGGAGTALPTPNVAWVGAPPPLPKAEFAALANGDVELRRGLEALHDLFRQAPLLGSLIEPVGGDLADPRRVARIEDSITALVERMRGAEPERAEGVVAARGMADAASILSRRWTLQATNVPFLGKSKQDDILAEYIEQQMPYAKHDLATAMIERMHQMASVGGSVAAVSGQNWWYLGSYSEFRSQIIDKSCLNLIVQLGDNAFQTPMYSFNIGLTISTNVRADDFASFIGIDASLGDGPAGKSLAVVTERSYLSGHYAQRRNPDSRITILQPELGSSLSEHAESFQGIKTGDDGQYRRSVWELQELSLKWRYFQSTVEQSMPFGGCESAVRWNTDGSHLARRQGLSAFGKLGVGVSQMGHLPVTLHTGAAFDSNISAIIPKNRAQLSAIWTFCSSPAYLQAIRKIDRKIAVANATLVKVPFNLAYWQRLATETYPQGLPEPYADDPTQWLFHGHPRYATPGTELQVSLARLAGYRWPAEIDTSMRLSAAARTRLAETAALPPADVDGLLPLSPLLGERGLADRLRAWCAAAWGKAWTADTEAALITAACERAKDKPPRSLTLDAWLRTHAARQHAKLFQERPFLWWVTDGRADGFMAVVHYHRLTRDALSRLAFHVLGDHLTRLGEDPRAEAAGILQKKLEQIIEGEAPFDIFVRWKPLHEQSLGWDPDLDDGVRLNIRPFVEAEVLAHVPNVKYGVDRGKDVASAPWYGVFGGERRNDHHTTLAEKRDARAKAKA